MNMEQKETLLLDEEDAPIIVEQECEEFKPILNDFIKCYVESKDKSVEDWLPQKLQEQFPKRKKEEVQAMAEEIISTLKLAEEKQSSLTEAINNGRRKESWFASETKKALSAMSANDALKYLKGLDTAFKSVNDSLNRTLITKANTVSKNPCLDGFIAEQYHAQTFNLNAQAAGSEYRAKVLEPSGEAYAKNSVDIVIVDKNGSVKKRYQSKYCKNAKETEKAFKRGDYRGQQKLVPEEQQADIAKKSTSVLESPDGITSNPLTKQGAEQLRDEAQNGNWNELNWNEYKTKDLAMGIGKQAGHAALKGVAIGVGFDIAEKVWKGEKIEGKEVVKTAFVSGTDFGIKATVAGALKVAVEKDVIKFLPKGTPVETFAGIAHVGIESAKVLAKIPGGDLSVKEGIDKIEQTTVSTVAGLAAMKSGEKIAAQAAAKLASLLGIEFGPAGMAITGFVGGTIGYMIGSKLGEAVIKTAKQIGGRVKKKVKEKIADVIAVKDGLKSFLPGFL